MKKLKDFIINGIRGFCMALADSVPGVSGGTIAFLLGFYDKFIGSLDDIFRGKKEEKIEAIKFLIKIGIGWVIGFVIASKVLGSVLDTHIYAMSSLFLGFIIFAIPIVIHEEKETLKKNYKSIIFILLGIAFVVAITFFSPAKGDSGVNIAELNIGMIIYVFIAAMIAISAMVLPGISGSTLLLIFGLYAPIFGAIHKFLEFDFSVAPILIVFGLGIITGVLIFVRLIKKCLTKFRAQSIYAIIGMMIGSIYSILQGPTTLEVPQAAMDFTTFNIGFFVIGVLIIVALQGLKYFMDKDKKRNLEN